MQYYPSLACARQLYLAEDITELLSLGLTQLHVDIMDAHYVPNLCFSLDTARQMKQCFPQLKLDLHLMAENPEKYVDRLVLAGADRAAFHLTATDFAVRTLQALRSAGIRAGIAVNPSDPIPWLEPLLGEFDYLLLMSVEPGFSGQKFLESSYERLRRIAALRDGTNGFEIVLDGGITASIAVRLNQLGADGIVLGYPTIFDQPDGITNAWNRAKAAGI